MNKDLTSKIDLILKQMKMVYLNDNRPWVIGYSGGKDSTTVVQLTYTMLQNLSPQERKKDVYIVSSDTLIENPIVLAYLKDNLKKISNDAREKHLPLYCHMVHPSYDDTYWTNVIGKGLPTPTSIRFRWCTERLKIKPSNKFIEEKVKTNGEVIVLLGVRKAESIARNIRITKREIDGYLLTPHVTLENTYVYNPIVDLTTDEVWETLLNNNGNTPWGASNNDLFSLYIGADSGECPFTTTNDKNPPTCGNSRFGCWICTVVSEDKSLTGFIENGEYWLTPLLEFRSWLLSIRNKHEYRMQYRRDGNHYYKKCYINKLPIDKDFTISEDSIFTENNEPYIDLKRTHTAIKQGKNVTSSDQDKIYLDLIPTIDNGTKIDKSKILHDENGEYINVLGYGPFNFKARKLILRKLLEVQNIINSELEEDSQIELITLNELEMIDRIWDDEEDLSHRELVELYYDVMGKRLPWDSFKKPIFDKTTLDTISELCSKHNIGEDLVNKLLIETDKNKHYANKSVLEKSVAKVLNQRYLHKSIIEEINNDNK